VNDINMTQSLQKHRPVGDLRHKGAYELDLQQSLADRRERIDRNKLRLDFRIGLPGLQQPICLDGLSSEDA
jgi:hypothetical protein